MYFWSFLRVKNFLTISLVSITVKWLLCERFPVKMKIEINEGIFYKFSVKQMLEHQAIKSKHSLFHIFSAEMHFKEAGSTGKRDKSFQTFDTKEKENRKSLTELEWLFGANYNWKECCSNFASCKRNSSYKLCHTVFRDRWSQIKGPVTDTIIVLPRTSTFLFPKFVSYTCKKSMQV